MNRIKKISKTQAKIETIYISSKKFFYNKLKKIIIIIIILIFKIQNWFIVSISLKKTIIYQKILEFEIVIDLRSSEKLTKFTFELRLIAN